MDAVTNKGAIKIITTHYIDGTFVGSHGREVMDIINPTNGEAIAHVTLADEEDARRAIAAAKRAFADFGQTTKEERAKILRRLHEAVSAHIDDLTSAAASSSLPRPLCSQVPARFLRPRRRSWSCR